MPDLHVEIILWMENRTGKGKELVLINPCAELDAFKHIISPNLLHMPRRQELLVPVYR